MPPAKPSFVFVMTGNCTRMHQQQHCNYLFCTASFRTSCQCILHSDRGMHPRGTQLRVPYWTTVLYYTVYFFLKRKEFFIFFFIYCTDPQRGAGCGAFVNHSHSRDPGPHSNAVYLCDATYSKPTSQYRC